MRLIAAAAVAALAGLVVPSAVAAEPCPPIGDPAFGRPTDCRATAPRPVKPAADAKGKWKTTPDGARVFQFGDTTVRASGSVQFDFATGNAGRTR
jgi:hypothetical protein